MTISAKDRILAILKRASSHGATTWQLIDETRHSAAARRVWELITEDGYQIEKVQEGKGVYRWIYRGEPLPPKQQHLALESAHDDRHPASALRLVDAPPVL